MLLFSLLGTHAAQIQPEPEGYVDCPLCADPTHLPQDAFSIFTAGGRNTMTCQTAFDLGTLRLPEENCTFWQDRGATICQCALEPPPANNCTLCEDGESLPFPMKEGAPDKLCAQLQVEAKRDYPERCIAWQQTVGVYCGCDNPSVTSAEQQVCRLCGDYVDLPNPVTNVPLLTDTNQETSTSCGELEFSSNLQGASCDQYQILYGEACCLNAILPPTDDDDEETDGAFAQLSMKIISILAMILSMFHL
jgi:hypothetical protein